MDGSRPGLLRDRHNPVGLIEAKVVEEVFERFGPVLNLHIGGQVIGTTHEHPFFVYDKGWTPANRINVGDFVLTETGNWQRVDEVYDTGEWEVVYNLRVADHHTYFVGDGHWDWAAWAHNSCSQDYYFFEDLVLGGRSVFQKNGDGRAVKVKQDGGWVTLNAGSDAALERMLSRPNAVISINKVDQEDISAAPLTEKFRDWLNKITSKNGVDQNGNNFQSITGKPNDAPVSHHAHHTVLKKGTDKVETLPNGSPAPLSVYQYARETQKILQTAKIDPIFGYHNLAWAPNWGGHGSITKSPKPGLPGYTGNSYAKSVYDRISTITRTKSKILAELKDISLDFIHGVW